MHNHPLWYMGNHFAWKSGLFFFFFFLDNSFLPTDNMAFYWRQQHKIDLSMSKIFYLS